MWLQKVMNIQRFSSVLFCLFLFLLCFLMEVKAVCEHGSDKGSCSECKLYENNPCAEEGIWDRLIRLIEQEGGNRGVEFNREATAFTESLSQFQERHFDFGELNKFFSKNNKDKGSKLEAMAKEKLSEDIEINPLLPNSIIKKLLHILRSAGFPLPINSGRLETGIMGSYIWRGERLEEDLLGRQNPIELQASFLIWTLEQAQFSPATEFGQWLQQQFSHLAGMGISGNRRDSIQEGSSDSALSANEQESSVDYFMRIINARFNNVDKFYEQSGNSNIVERLVNGFSNNNDPVLVRLVSPLHQEYIYVTFNLDTQRYQIIFVPTLFMFSAQESDLSILFQTLRSYWTLDAMDNSSLDMVDILEPIFFFGALGWGSWNLHRNVTGSQSSFWSYVPTASCIAAYLFVYNYNRHKH